MLERMQEKLRGSAIAAEPQARIRNGLAAKPDGVPEALARPPRLPRRVDRHGAGIGNNHTERADNMLGIGERLPSFEVIGVKPGFNEIVENDTSALEPISEASFPGRWKVIFFYPKDFTFVCPTEISEFARLATDFEARNAVVLGGSTDNEFVKLAWRRDHTDLSKLPIWQFADPKGDLVDSLGVRSPEGVAYRVTFVVDPENVIQHIYATNLDVGRAPQDTLRVLDALQTKALCACNRPVGGAVLSPAA